MRITELAVKPATRVFDKVSGKTYEVVKVEGKGENKTAYASEVITDEDGTERLDETKPCMRIDASNDICFRHISTPEPSEILEGYSVERGILVKDDKAVTKQGKIVVEEIITAIPGYLILAVKCDKNGYVDIYSYDPERDRFTALVYTTLKPQLVMKGEADAVLGYSCTHLETATDKDGNPVLEDGEPKMAKVFDGAALIRVTGKDANVRYFTTPVVLKLMPVLGSETEYLVESAGRVSEEDKVVTEEEVPFYQAVHYSDDEFYQFEPSYQPKGRITTASKVRFGRDYGLRLFYKGPGFIQFGEICVKDKLTDGLEGNYLVDVSDDSTVHTTTLTLCDDRKDWYTIERVVIRHTKDRGDIVSVDY